jgi:hypothetical protein
MDGVLKSGAGSVGWGMIEKYHLTNFCNVVYFYEKERRLP